MIHKRFEESIKKTIDNFDEVFNQESLNKILPGIKVEDQLIQTIDGHKNQFFFQEEGMTLKEAGINIGTYNKLVDIALSKFPNIKDSIEKI